MSELGEHVDRSVRQDRRAIATVGTVDVDAVAARLFTAARTHHGWLAKPVPAELLRAAYELASSGPTSMNCQPLRVKFVRDGAAKADLLSCLNEGNVAKTEQAPVTAIFGHDLGFAERLPMLFPHKPLARSMYDSQPALAQATAFRNGSLQAGYFLIAARLLGLDCGPMSGVDLDRVDALFWAGTQVRTNFLCNLGYGDPAVLHARGLRLAFDEACEVLP